MLKYVSKVTTLAGFGSRKSFQLTKGQFVEGLTDEEYEMLGDNIMAVFEPDPPPPPPEPEPEPEPEPAPDYSGLTIEQLRAELDSRELSTDGTKEDLLDRLAESDAT